MGGGGGECDAAQMIAFAEKSSAEEQYEIASTLYACRQPMLLSTCDNGTVFNFDQEGSCYSTPSTCANDQTSLCSTTATEKGKICACKKSTNVNYAVACPSAIITGHGGGGGGGGGGGSVSSPSPSDTTGGTGGTGGDGSGDGSGIIGSTSSPSPSPIGNAVVATLQDVKLNLDIEIELRGSEARIKLTGPSNRYFAIAFNTRTMDNSYSIILEPTLGAHERTLGPHAAGKCGCPIGVFVGVPLTRFFFCFSFTFFNA
jgi:hypothetical protein